jgi:hypothetical protein
MTQGSNSDLLSPAARLEVRLPALFPALVLLSAGAFVSPTSVSADELPSKDALRSEVSAAIQQAINPSAPAETLSTQTEISSNPPEASPTESQPSEATPTESQPSVSRSAEHSSTTTSSPDAASKKTAPGESTATATHAVATTKSQSDTESSASVVQAVSASASTGHNQANRNISIGGNAGVITTGNAHVGVTGVVSANEAAVSADTAKQHAVVSSNGAVIHQAAALQANTGNNTAERNIGMGGSSGLIQTGQASTSTAFLTSANQGVSVFSGAPNANGAPGTGASVYINTSVDPRYHQSVYRKDVAAASGASKASASQTCGTTSQASTTSCSVSTGHNTASRGVAYGGNAGAITTGAAYLQVFQNAFLNQSALKKYAGNPHAVSSSSTSSDAEINQSVHVSASTGHNTADRNISFGGDAGVIQTGDAVVTVVMTASASDSTTSLLQPPPTPIEPNPETPSPVDPPPQPPTPELVTPPPPPSAPAPALPTTVATPAPILLQTIKLTTAHSTPQFFTPHLSYDSAVQYHYPAAASNPTSPTEKSLLSTIAQVLAPAVLASSTTADEDPCIPATTPQTTGMTLPENPYGMQIGGLFALLAAGAASYLVRPFKGIIK